MIPKILQGGILFWTPLSTFKNQRFGTIWKVPTSLSLKKWRSIIGNPEYFYWRYWKPWTQYYIGTHFSQRINYGSGSWQLQQNVRHGNLLKKTSLCHEQAVQYNVNKPPHIRIRLFAAKENEAMKQVAYELKELSQFWQTLCLMIVVILSNDLWCFLCLVIEILLAQNTFSSLKCTFRARISEDNWDKTDNLIEIEIKL